MESIIQEPLTLPATKYMESSDDEDIFLKRTVVKTKLFNSDEENSESITESAYEKNTESDTDKGANEKLHTSKIYTKRILRELGSDSDENEDNGNDLLSMNANTILSNELVDYAKDGASTGELNVAISSDVAATDVPPEIKQKSLFSQSDLYDAENSDDDNVPSPSLESYEDRPTAMTERTPKEKPKMKKPKEKKISKPKPPKEDIKKVRSESQRIVRESRVSLPYHRPRQRTLAEFLSRRDHVVLPVKSLKTSPTKLGAMWKTLEKKVREAEEFYKSDSDSGQDDEDQSHGLGGEQATKDDRRENELENKEETPSASDGATSGQVVESTNLEEGSRIPVQTVCDGPKDKVVDAELDKIVFTGESSDGKLDSSIISDGCGLREEGLVEPVDNGRDNNAISESTGVSESQSDLKITILNEGAGDHKVESDLQASKVDCTHDNENDSEIPSILNNILDAVTKDQTNSKSDDLCARTWTENPEPSTCSNDFSNLFPKTEMQKGDGELKLVNSRSITLSSEHSDELLNSEKLHAHKNSNSGIKIPSPPPLEDSESISLRLDDDTVDETGPKPECSHISALVETPGDDANSKSKTMDEAGPPWVTTPVKMLMEMEEVGAKGSAEDNETESIDNRKNSLSPAPGVHHSTAPPIQLEGGPDKVIDLDEDVRANPKKEMGVRDLMQRFIKNHIPKKVACKEKKVEVGIEIVEGDGDKGSEKVKREVMSVTLGGNDPIKNASPATERPGARLRSLREELQREITRKRDEEWAKRQQEMIENEEDEDGGKCNLDNEEEEELTESSSSEEEEEEEDEEENDVDMSTKSRPRSAYVDDEAEESDDEEGDVGQDNEDDDEGSSLEEREGGQEEEESLMPENELEEEKNESKEVPSDVKETPTKVKEEEEGIKVDSASSKKSRFQRFKTFDLFDSEDDGDVNECNSGAEMTSPPSTPFMQNRNGAQSRLSLPSPALPLTALQRYTNSPIIDQTNPWAFTHKQLFDDEESPKQSKDGDNSLKGKSALINLVGQSQGSEVAEDELLNLMSGAFLSRVNKMSDAEDDFSLALEDTQELFDKSQSKEKIKEEETTGEKSQKDFKSFVNSSWSKLTFSFSDENDKDDGKEMSLGDDLKAVMKRKKLKQLDISDDEDDEQKDKEDVAENESLVSEEGSANESSDDGEEEEEESDVDEEDGEERVVEYDSEENAIEVKRPVKKVRGPKRGLEFLDEEAELSEGEEEWDGSGDEDEHGLDRMEKEAGDADKLDDEIVRRELGRIHMRQILDEDKREVRIIQEMLLEDGELHADGQGRERKFRWRNVDIVDDGEFRPLDSGDEEKVEDEDENEEKWRRLRHERETWLREHQENGKIGDSESLLNEIEEDSQLLKLGRAALRRVNSFPNNALTKWLKSAVEPKDKDCESVKPPEKEPESPDVKRPFQLLCKRGSFLARKDGTLERLAEMAIRNGGGIEPECLTSKSPVVAKTKNSHKFVFTVLSPEKKIPKARVEAPKEDSLPVKKTTKRKKRDIKQTEGIAKKSKHGKEASIFQFL